MPPLPDHDYPRPQLRRSTWNSLNGEWDFALDVTANAKSPGAITWRRSITVPFAPETPASGVHETGFFTACWYRRQVTVPTLQPGERLMLHFGAVDTVARVWIDDRLIGGHDGGYTPFSFDITDAVHMATSETVEIIVQATDDPADLAKPRGKQDWHLAPHGIWYPRTTGIWQSVWWERVPATAIARIAWTSDVAAWEIGIHAELDGAASDGHRLQVVLSVSTDDGEHRVLADDTYLVANGEVTRSISLVDPGIDDARKELLWSPETPTLIDARLTLLNDAGDPIDSVESYTAMRSITTRDGRFVLNGRPVRLRMVLDQGYWPNTGLTAPDSNALRIDVELTKAMGFNGARKHQKIEDPRYLYWADRLGLFVWEELPSAYRFSTSAVERATRLWTSAIERDRSHPCIIAWVPFNESWGVPDLPENPAHRAYVTALYHLTRTLDQTRPAIANDGWETGPTDVVGIHDYDESPERLAARYGDLARMGDRYWGDHVSGRLLLLADHVPGDQPVMLSEFGGIAYVPASETTETWGYSRATSAEEFGRRYTALLAAVRSLDGLAGFCYTQFTDTYQEANGLLFADRTPKIPLADIALATRGPKSAREREREHRAALDAKRTSINDGGDD